MSGFEIEFYHKELKDWSSTLHFYEDEVKVFEDRLDEVLNKNTKDALRAEAAHFQNQFSLQKNQLDRLLLDISRQKSSIGTEVQPETPAADPWMPAIQHQLRNKVQSEERLFMETKHSFYRFLSKVF